MREFKLYDTLSRTVKPITTSEPGHLKFYSCGPTVYSYAHIGNFRTFLTTDLVIRTAEAIGWDVTYVSNITDVGHLTQDDVADAAGDDKMAKALASKEGDQFANVWDLARFYAEAFEDDWKRLNLKTPTVRPRATEHMREQIVAVNDLIKRARLRNSDRRVFQRRDSFEEYGKLSGNTDRENLQVAVRDVVQDDNKKNPADFALWKKDDKHLMQWFSPWGWGFPGWHIECSVMAQKYLGDTIDLHGGGEDLKFPHHECEIAQSEAGTGKPFCNHWMHVTFLQVEGEKMSKSKGNFFTVRDLLEQGFDPIALRYALISVPYRKPHNFTIQTLKDSEGNVERFREAGRRIEAVLGEGWMESAGDFGSDQLGQELSGIYGQALNAMLDDLNTSVAIAKALEGTKAILRINSLSEADAKEGAAFLAKVEALLGITGLTATQETEEEAEPEIEGKLVSIWVTERDEAKKNKDYGTSDLIRDKLTAAGIELRDTPDGTVWAKR
ncbi:MAG: cysteine--tRNA ligase [Fimbriimonadaceae bacterium]